MQSPTRDRTVRQPHPHPWQQRRAVKSLQQDFWTGSKPLPRMLGGPQRAQRLLLRLQQPCRKLPWRLRPRHRPCSSRSQPAPQQPQLPVQSQSAARQHLLPLLQQGQPLTRLRHLHRLAQQQKMQVSWALRTQQAASRPAAPQQRRVLLRSLRPAAAPQLAAAGQVLSHCTAARQHGSWQTCRRLQLYCPPCGHG